MILGDLGRRGISCHPDILHRQHVVQILPNKGCATLEVVESGRISTRLLRTPVTLLCTRKKAASLAVVTSGISPNLRWLGSGDVASYPVHVTVSMDMIVHELGDGEVALRCRFSEDRWKRTRHITPCSHLVLFYPPPPFLLLPGLSLTAEYNAAESAFLCACLSWPLCLYSSLEGGAADVLSE